MEEKARLAREQEMQQRLKSQVPLQLQSSTTNASPASKPAVRDLSSTLSSNPGFPLPTGTTVNQSASLSFPGSSGGMQPATGVSWGNMGASFGPSVGQTSAPKAQEPSKKSVDLSSFDNLLPMAPKARPSMSSMTSQPMRAPGPNPFGTPVGMPPPLAAGPSIGAMPAGMTAQTSSFGSSSAFGGAYPGNVGTGASVAGGGMGTMMGSGPMFGGASMGLMGSGGMPLIRPPMSNMQPSMQSTGTTPLTNKDIADLLG
jgi:hypothetical protein